MKTTKKVNIYNPNTIVLNTFLYNQRKLNLIQSLVDLQTNIEDETFSFNQMYDDDYETLTLKVKESLEALYEFQRKKTENFYKMNKKDILK